MDPSSSTAALLALQRETPQHLGEVGLPAGADQLVRQELGLLADSALARAAADVSRWRESGIEVLAPFDPRYPHQLQVKDDHGPLLFAVGDVGLLRAPSVAVVGTRRPTSRGMRAAAAIARRLASDGFVVTSGLAAGIDTAAHLAALDAGGKTVAVIGTGPDRCYPRQNERLQQRIADEGCVVSQFLPGTPPRRSAFPARNGLMARLAQATVIVEAGERSGTRIQARMSLRAGRKLLLLTALLDQPWARELAGEPGVDVVASPAELSAALLTSGAGAEDGGRAAA